MVSQIVWLGVKDVFTQITKDVVGQGLDNGRRSVRGLIQNQCGVSSGTIACSDVTEGDETQKPDVFTQIAKDVVGQGLDNGTLTFKAKFARVIRVKMADSHRKQFYALGRRSVRGLIQNQCGVSSGTIACSDVTEGDETQKPVSRMAKI
ncbi:hypothetical protein F2Q69_00006849 [Brassica cretica]|uniref:Uncharacterized protein n=1 Tax=Brassica cretica TaxID=69181 RepID=A0A8S9P5T8_BRACR|nr:hypothetical protein F2Q69_00006849 [Brassica cretica]